MSARRRVAALVAPMLAGTAVLVVGSAASADPQRCDAVPGRPVTCVTGDKDTFQGIGVGGAAGGGAVGPALPKVPGGTDRGPAGDERPSRVVVRALAPICQGNTPSDGGTVCNAALVACEDDGDIAYWVWRQEVEAGTAPDPARWRKVLDPPYVCRGPAEAGVPTRDQVAGVVQREFATYGIRRGRLVVDPEGETLVGFRTRFWTDAAAYTFSRSILGLRVDITATPERYEFHFGDGTSETRRPSRVPRPGTDDLVHAYRRSGAVVAHVVVEWSGSYVIAGSPQVLRVRGTATTTGPPTHLQVREARSQYESG